MTQTALTSLPSQVIDDAINWSIKLAYNTPDAATQQAFEQWLQASAEHAQAWGRMQSLGSQFAGLPKGALLQTLNKLPEARLQRRQVLKLLSLFATLGASTWVASERAPWQRLVADYSTVTGEHRQWTLADGSVLDLNTDSAVQLRFDAEQRLLVLLRGQLALTSGNDAAASSKRPLRVQTPQCLLQALGTQFDVRLQQDATLLAVTEGAVSIRQPARSEAIVVPAGESWRIDARLAVPVPVSAADSMAWRDDMLIARALPLADVLAELSRYRVGYLGCDPQIARLPISGNFSTATPEATLTFLAQAHQLNIQRVTRYWVRLLPA